MAATILILPVGEVEADLLAELCSALRVVFHQACSLGQPLPFPGYAYSPHRGQYDAHEILRRLPRGEADRVLGVVDLDLYVPELNFVFGLANPLGRQAVIALKRLRQEFYRLPADRELFRQRTVKEAVHELGHTFGLSHCRNRRCVMAFSNSLVDTDLKGQSFCSQCQGKL